MIFIPGFGDFRKSRDLYPRDFYPRGLRIFQNKEFFYRGSGIFIPGIGDFLKSGDFYPGDLGFLSRGFWIF